ncbi:unnamed protein product [Allacma fusca]|uniref:EGF-like domain-containing protein n=1 Tax=Allacma fusca TaxID=39272 RepID=A0A8J2KYQ9_9HEXA|nr:unnamed protein product [Allacma fusca]
MSSNTRAVIRAKLGHKIVLAAIATACLTGLLIFVLTRFSNRKPFQKVMCDSSKIKNPESCSCPSGETQSSNGNCVQTFGGSCEKSIDCEDNLVCHSGKCICRLLDQKYSKGKNFCISRIGGPCIGSFGCPELSFCKKFVFQEYGMCQCNGGFLVSPEGHCEGSYLQSCSSLVPCDSISGLACIDGFCRCQNFGWFDEGRRVCLGLVGSTCDLSLKEESSCVENAECLRQHPKLPPTCTCKQGFSVDATYTCEEWSKK